jgi:uncharacterized protein (TIGR01777 family)
MKTVLITGASGLIGSHLTKLLKKKDYRVIHLSRSASENLADRTFVWDVEKRTIDDEAVRQADFIIHLAGAGIAEKRWTAKRKNEIISSRVESARLLFESVQRNNKRPEAFISASAVGYYGAFTSDKIFVESDAPANDFLALCCQEWEKSAFQFSELGLRTTCIRTGVVLSEKGGALEQMARPVKYGIGSAFGSGKQYVPWIHIDDICGIYLKSIENRMISGTFNATSPEHVTNEQLLSAIAKTLGKPFFFPKIPGWLLRLALGEMSVMLLEGSRVSSEKIKKAGFSFKYDKIENALRSLLDEKN